MAEIKQILVGTLTYDIEALHFKVGSLDTPTSWKGYIDAQAGAGFSFIVSTTASDTPKGVTFTPKGSSTPITGTLEAADAVKGIYLVYHPHNNIDAYDEYVPVEESATSKVWEKIGNTDIDLSQYATKAIAAKAGTYTTTVPNTNVTSSTDLGTATGSATITYAKVNAATGLSGATTTSVTGSTFTGSSATITSTGTYTPAGTVASHNHSITSGSTDIYQITGVGTLPALTVTDKTVTVTSATQPFNVVTGITGGTASGSTVAITGYPNFNGGSASGSFNTDAIKAITGTVNYGFSTSTSKVMTAPTVNNGILSWTESTAGTSDAHTGTAATKGNVSWTAASLGAASTVSVITGVTPAAISSSQTLTPTSVGSASGWNAGSLPSRASVSVVNSVNATTGDKQPGFTGTSATITVSATYTPSGTVTGGQVTIASHTHSIGTTNDTVTGNVEVAIGAHTHSLSNHTHNVVIPNCEA